MKRTCNALSIALFIITTSLFSQTEKGKFLVGISSGLGLNGGQTNFSFSNVKVKSDDFESDNTKNFSFNLSPRTGYFLTDNLTAGLELNYSFFSIDRPDDDPFIGGESKFNQYSAGPFIRYYFNGEKIRPIIEGGVSFGRSTNTLEGANPVDGGELEFSSNLFSYAGGSGFAVSLGNQVSFDAIVVYLNSQSKPTENNEDNSRSIVNSLGLRLGFSIYLGNTQSQTTLQEK